MNKLLYILLFLLPLQSFAVDFSRPQTGELISILGIGSTTFSVLNVGWLYATTGTSYINALTLGTALADAQIASASTWNAKEASLGTGNAGEVLTMSNGTKVWAATSTCAQITGSADLCDGTDATGAGGSYPFTPTSVFNINTSGTSSAMFTSLGYYASSTSIFSTTTVQGALNVGTLTATSGTSYLNALSLGTALADANIASADTWNAKQAAISITSPVFLSGATISIDQNYKFNAGLGSTTFPILNVGTLTATTGTSYINSLILGTKLANAQLANSTISGVALGGTLGALTATNGTLTFSASYDGSAAATVGLNLGSANIWTGATTFNANVSMNGQVYINEASGSTTVPTNLFSTSIFATSTVGVGGTTTPGKAAKLGVVGDIFVGGSGTTSIILQGKLCFQGNNTAGTPTRVYVKGTAWVIEAGNCK